MKPRILAIQGFDALVEYKNRDTAFYGFYNDDLKTIYLHTMVDYFTRFVVFYENDTSPDKQQEVLKKLQTAKVEDMSGKGLSPILKGSCNK